MPVNINEFEVVVDQPRSAPAESSSQNAPEQSKRGATPHEIENILRRQKERILRLLAH
jgi:hypothetical protein